VRAIANPLQDLTTDSQYVADYLKTIHGPVVLTRRRLHRRVQHPV